METGGLKSIFHEIAIKAMLFDNHPKPVWIKQMDRISGRFLVILTNKAFVKKYGDKLIDPKIDNIIEWEVKDYNGNIYLACGEI